MHCKENMKCLKVKICVEVVIKNKHDDVRAIFAYYHSNAVGRCN